VIGRSFEDGDALVPIDSIPFLLRFVVLPVHRHQAKCRLLRPISLALFYQVPKYLDYRSPRPVFFFLFFNCFFLSSPNSFSFFFFFPIPSLSVQFSVLLVRRNLSYSWSFRVPFQMVSFGCNSLFDPLWIPSQKSLALHHSSSRISPFSLPTEKFAFPLPSLFFFLRREKGGVCPPRFSLGFMVAACTLVTDVPTKAPVNRRDLAFCSLIGERCEALTDSLSLE